MATLLSLLSRHPILELILPNLPLASLLNLAKLNSEYRAILHGFPLFYPSRDLEDLTVRPSLHIGQHQTQLWNYHKSMCRLECSETFHTKGTNVRPCRTCSMPVCEACIVKKSFNKKENKFNSRRRYVCKDCWQVDRPQATQSQFQAYESALLDHDSNEICHCTPKNAVLCLSCKDGQNRDLHKQIDHCAGFGCSIALTAENIGGSYCLWCNLMLTKASTSQQSRRLFNSRYEPQLVAYAQVIGMKRSLAGYEPMEYFKKQRNLEDKFRTEILEGLGANLSHPMLTGTATPFDEDCIIINRRDNEATEEHVKAERAMYKTEVEAAHQSSSCRLELEGLEDEDYVLVETDSQPESPRTVVGDTKTSAKEDWESVAFGDDISSSQTLPK